MKKHGGLDGYALCRELRCQPGDLLEFVPAADGEISANEDQGDI